MSDKFQQDANVLADFLDSFGQSADGKTNITFDDKLFGITPENKKALAKHIRLAKKVFGDDAMAKLKKISESYDVIYEDRDGKKTLFLGFDADRYWEQCKVYHPLSGTKSILQHESKNMDTDLTSEELPELDTLVYRCKCYNKYKWSGPYSVNDMEPCSCDYVNLPGSFVGDKITIINSSGDDIKKHTGWIMTKKEYTKYLRLPPKFLVDGIYLRKGINVNYEAYLASTQKYAVAIHGGICEILNSRHGNEPLLTDELLEEINPVVNEYHYVKHSGLGYIGDYPKKILESIHKKYDKPVYIFMNYPSSNAEWNLPNPQLAPEFW